MTRGGWKQKLVHRTCHKCSDRQWLTPFADLHEVDRDGNNKPELLSPGVKMITSEQTLARAFPAYDVLEQASNIHASALKLTSCIAWEEHALSPRSNVQSIAQ